MLNKSSLLIFEIRTNSRNASLTFLLVTRLHYSNLYNRIEQFERFVRESDMHVKNSL